ncbi:MAG: hypothetical protein AAF573_08165 [Bacteroidota bacterium]
MMKCFTFTLSILFAILFVFSSCTPSQQIEKTFYKIQDAENVEEMIEWLDEASIEYFKKMGEIAVKQEYKAVGQFCYNSAAPLSTRYLIAALHAVGPSDTTVVIELEEVLRNISFMNFGLLGEETKLETRFLGVQEINDADASAEISFKVAKNINVKSIVKFYLEDGKWKLNFPSTLSYPEKYFNNLWRQRGGNLQEFIQGVVENGGEAVNWMVMPRRIN